MNQSPLFLRGQRFDLLNQDTKLDGKNQKRFGKLKWAIFSGQREIVDSLLIQNTPVDVPRDANKDFRSPLHSAVYLGDVNIVKKLLAKGASPNVVNENNETALMLAAKFRKYEIVDLLLSQDGLMNCVNDDNFSHLHIACLRNRVDVVKRLMECKADIDLPVEFWSVYWAGYTPLHFAVDFECVETVQFLVSIGADITIRNYFDNTALHLADSMRNEKIIDIILEGHTFLTQNPVNSDGLSHFHIACTRNKPKFVMNFIKSGVPLDQQVKESSSTWAKFTGLDFAIYYECVDNVKLLLIEGGRKMFPSSGKVDRVMNAYFTGNEMIINLILFRDELAQSNNTLMEKASAVYTSCAYSDNEAIMDSIAKNPEALNASFWQGNTPLHLVVERRMHDSIEYLLNCGADCNIKNAIGKTPLHLAFDKKDKPSLSLMMKKLDSITKNPIDNYGLSHFHIACSTNEVDVVERFVEFGADVNTPVQFNSTFWPGFTPLHFAARFRQVEVANTLLKRGASYAITDKNGLSAFDVAIAQSRDDLEGEKALEIMKSILLSRYNSQIDAFNDRGFSLLHLLSADNSDKSDAIKEFIVKHQSDVNQAVHTINSPWDGFTPLHFAMSCGHSNHSKLLVKMGADILSEDNNGDTPFHMSVNRVRVPEFSMDTVDFARTLHNPVGTNGYSLFHVACIANNMEWVRYFLDHNVDPNFRTMMKGYEFADETALHLATRDTSSIPRLELVQLLLENGANANARDLHLNTPLHFLSNISGPKIIEQLVKNGADVNSRNASIETPLITISDNEYCSNDDKLRQMIESLLDYGASLNSMSENGMTPMTVTIWDRYNEFTSSIEALLKHLIKCRVLSCFNKAFDRPCIKLSISLATELSPEAKFKLNQFSKECMMELFLMQKVRVNIYTSFYDILFKDLNKLSVIDENILLREMVESNDFLTKYPHYGSMIRLQLKLGRDRRPLLIESQRVLKSLIRMLVPRECLEQILLYLTNEDLKNIILSRRINLSSRD
ncbi:hypothetical protein QAD02_010803 [Eretmocerus hayati]|uniref:Uncharacterized protein n=1 Tax=Eretmocerus hayati TaxID=131215 RepID=A0ACC2NVB3_9HYME|nr:hypothetical protein QAD02_010803 [Eretmocerus hayati]